jgi:hypothetical protein
MPKGKWKGPICKHTRPRVRPSSLWGVRSYPLPRQLNLSHLYLNRQHVRQGGAGRSGARDGRGGGRASSPTGAPARHTGEHLLPPRRAATASRRSVLSSAAARPLLPRAPVVTQLLLLRQPTIARPLLPRTGGLIRGAKARCHTGLTSAVGRAYNGAETGDKAWEHEPPSPFRETTVRSSPRRGEGIFEKNAGSQSPVVRALRSKRITYYGIPWSVWDQSKPAGSQYQTHRISPSNYWCQCRVSSHHISSHDRGGLLLRDDLILSGLRLYPIPSVVFPCSHSTRHASDPPTATDICCLHFVRSFVRSVRAIKRPPASLSKPPFHPPFRSTPLFPSLRSPLPPRYQ